MAKGYSIGKIAKIFNITTNKIRFYEKKGLLLPIREKDNEYRKFNEEGIIRLQSILLYRSIGLTIKDIKSKFLNNNFDIIGIDQSREMLSVAKQKYPKLKVRLGEFLKIPYDNKYFDVIISTYAFQHLNELEKVIAIEEMIRVLKDNGIIVIGDLMFKSKDDEKNILNELSKKQVDEIKDEYYSHIDILENELKKYNKKLYYKRIDKFNYIIKVK
ncbi:MerR family transcriptional regulator [Clostridium botulinum]|uniref:MerR family transcriptional regulator n=1 Tax=Clostridium botulinum TaxID=1491 RepID=UPI0004DA0255|nr:methyltransferase domain-containing protein [Clostridium botulinum]KEH94009.1 hypothetical protein Z963_00400 [Clostridium botulinum C/D str. It1]